jgi:ATP-dependent DNA ligase
VQFSALPEPMLAKSGKLPTRGAWSYEVKWDGFRGDRLHRGIAARP